MATNKLQNIRPQRANANRHTQRGLGMLEQSIRRDGVISAITVAADEEVFDGSATTETLAALGLLDNPIVVRSKGDRAIIHIREDIPTADHPRAKRLGVAANRVASVDLEWDTDILADLQQEGDVLDGLFFEDELADLLGSVTVEGAGGDDFDTTPQDGPTRVQRGEVWRIGAHRLMCGDSTNPQDVERLMGGERADMVFTDPPYNVGIAGGTHDPRDEKNYGKGPRIDNDAMSDSEFDGFLLLACEGMKGALKPGGAYYVCAPAGRTETQFRNALDKVIGLRQCIVWVKQQFVFGRQDYHWRHESILYGWKDGAAHYFTDDKTQDTVWEIDRPMRSEKEHPTQKPVALSERAITNSSRRGQIVLDLFCGTGSTLVAGQRTRRKCYGMEISPAYCDVILRRAEAEGIGPIERMDGVV